MTFLYGGSTAGSCCNVGVLPIQPCRDYRGIKIDSADGQTRIAELLASSSESRVPKPKLDMGRMLVASGLVHRPDLLRRRYHLVRLH